MKHSVGCGCCDCSRSIAVAGCTTGGFNGISGASVTVSGSGGSASGTTDATGVFAFSLPSGTYTVTIPAIGGFGAYSSSITVNCSTGQAPFTVTLTADDDHVCTTCCKYPIAKALTGSYAGETFALNYDEAGSSSGSWVWRGNGTQEIAAGIGVVTVGTNPDCDFTTGNDCFFVGSTLNVDYVFTCTSAFGASFGMDWKDNACRFPCLGTPGTEINFRYTNAEGWDMNAGNFGSVSSCSPFVAGCILPTTGTSSIPGLGDTSPTPGGGGFDNPVAITE